MIIGSCPTEVLFDILKYKNTTKYRLLNQYSTLLIWNSMLVFNRHNDIINPYRTNVENRVSS